MKARMPTDPHPVHTNPKRHRYIRDLPFPAILLSLIVPSSKLLCRGQEGRALNYQLPTGPPTKSNRNYEPVMRPRGPVSPLFFLPRSFLPSSPHVRRFISYVHADEEQCENWGSVSPGCRHSSYSRGGTHMGATRRAASQSGAGWPVGRSVGPRDEAV